MEAESASLTREQAEVRHGAEAEMVELDHPRQEDESKLKKLQEKLDYQEDHQAANLALNVLLMEKEVLIKNLETSIVSLETVCQESKNDKEAVKSRLEKEQEDFRASLDRLQADLFLKGSELAAKETVVDKLKGILEESRKEAQQAQDERESLTSTLGKIRKTELEYQGSLYAIQQELADVKAEKAMLTNQVQALETQVKAATDLQILAKTEAEELRIQLNRETALAAEKTAELEEVLVQGQELALKIGRLQQELEHQVSKGTAANATIVKVWQPS